MGYEYEKSVRISSFNANSAEEFWLKANLSGLVYGADSSFDDKDRKIAELMDRVKNLEWRLSEYKTILGAAVSAYEKSLKENENQG